MQKFVQEHSLGLIVNALALVFGVLFLLAAANDWKLFQYDQADIWLNLFCDTYGAWIVVELGKWFREKGSPESKEPQEQ